jgi:hypothetical protein
MAFNYFYIKPITTNIHGLNVTYPVAMNTTSCVDVHGQLKWKNSGNISEVPRILLTEYSLDYGAWTSNLARLLNGGQQAAQGNLDPYQALYFGTKTGFAYSLPYLLKSGDSIRGAIKNNWVDSDQGIGDVANKAFGGSSGSAYKQLMGIGQAIANVVTPGYGTEPVKAFGTTSENEITISFPLYNTGSVEDATNNFSFISLFSFQNMKTRTSFLSYLPPKIYSIDGMSAGSVYMPAATVTNLDVQSIGTTRAIDDISGFGSVDGRVLIPEAYKVTITFKELLSQSSNIYWGTIGGTKPQVVLPSGNATGITNP